DRLSPNSASKHPDRDLQRRRLLERCSASIGIRARPTQPPARGNLAPSVGAPSPELPRVATTSAHERYRGHEFVALLVPLRCAGRRPRARRRAGPGPFTLLSVAG